MLRLFLTGATSKEAGRDLGISPRTIEDHRARILKKLGARTATELMRIVAVKELFRFTPPPHPRIAMKAELAPINLTSMAELSFRNAEATFSLPPPLKGQKI